MKTNSRFLLAATLGLALAFTFSCSSDDGNNNNDGTSSGSGSSSPSGGGVPFNENSQIYDYKTGVAFTGSGTIEVVRGSSCNDDACKWAAGSVTSGLVNLQLPPTIPSENFKDIFSGESCSAYGDIKVFKPSLIRLTNSDGNSQLVINYKDEQTGQVIDYWYFSKAGNITCDNKGSNRTMTINATAGWNTIYRVTDRTSETLLQKYSTNNILTKAVKWEIAPLD